eukprot:TRINITY_DN38822_c0_g1_i2.p1 TRINITY_DN38822_c0_g1~~TRINITY_DN38822_c0_g1_i2.p1  ORF type:complete len:194 (-),score=17.71 TRINITY_DN38822_c0_g1_i2:258-839(-)
MIFGEGWHTDSPFLAQPPAISVLRGVDIPPYGGDTIWASTALAHDYLSPAFQRMISNLKVHMSAGGVMDALSGSSRDGGVKAGDVEMAFSQQEMAEGRFHPLVRTHPVTGRKALYLGQTYACGIEGMSDGEAGAMLGFLESHATNHSFTCRLRWRPHTVCMWDNRSCIHHAFNDHDGFRRELYRSTTKGEAPV